MATLDDARATQIRNIESKTGKSMAALFAMVAGSGLAKVGEQRQWLIDQLGLGYGDANAVVLMAKAAREGGAAGPAAADPLDAIYSGVKAGLRPLHDALMQRIAGLGDFEIAPKKSYLSLRRKKQFAMLGPATAKLVEIGLNSKTLTANARLKAMPPGGMCQFTTRLGDAAEIDAALLGWMRQAYNEAG